MGWTVAKQPKKNSGPKPEPEPQGEEKVSEPVKLRLTFKTRLQRVAMHHKLDMGVLIENRMSEYINREYKLIVEAELRQMQAEGQGE